MIQTQLHKQRSDRFNGYLEYSLSDKFISYVTVQDQRLYFPKYDNNVTIADLNQQYSLIHEGKELSLETELFKIDPTTPLAQITSTPQKIEVLEKVLTSCKQHKDPLADIKKTEQIKLAQDLVSFVKKHNQKIQSTKDFQSHDCLIKVKFRPESEPEFNYFVVETSTFNEIAEMINKIAGNIVQLISVQLGNGVTYSRSSLLSKPFIELKMNSKQLTFIYPQILTLKNDTKFKIKLTNSPYVHEVVELNVKKQHTIAGLLNAIKKIIDVHDDPLQIRDSQGNLIDHDKWKNPLSSFIYRKFHFQFLYPTFLNYECDILVTNFPGKTYKLKYLVHKDTTFNQIVKYINENIHCQNGNFRIMDSKGKVYGPQARNKTLFSLKIQETVFRFVYVKPSCFIRANTNVIAKSRKGQLEQITVKELLQSEKINQLQIMTYNEEKHRMDYGRVTCFKKESGFSKMLLITLAGDEDIINFECSADATFKTLNFVWKPARMLEKGEKIMTSRSDLQNVHYAEVIAVKQIAIEGEEQLFTLQVSPHHNFLANGIILHNDESYPFDVHFYQASKPPRKQSLKCYLNQKLREVPAFKGKKLMMGGLILKNNLTFGDYQLYNFGTIFAFDQNYNQTSQDFIISAWREQSYKDQDVDHMLRDKWSSDFWGLHKSNIVEINKDIQTMKSSKTPEQLLVCPKMHLKKLNYVNNIAPKYKPYEQKMMNSHFRPMIWEQQHFKSQLLQLMASNDEFLQSEMDILPVYMYTTNLVYQQMNNFLRMPQHPRNNSQQIQQIIKWYTFTNRLINSLDKLPSVQYTTLYRGMRNISIGDAFGIKNKNLSVTKDTDKYLILQGFTSTTKDKGVALGFIAGKGVLMTIKSHSGKSIANYSQYKEEGQVLLPPFLYFKITRLLQNPGGIDEIDLQEIPFPRTDRKKLIFWVDDIPAGNRSIIENQFQPQGIQVVQVMSTSIMKIILRDFFGILQALGKQIVIISDMGRYEDGAWNCEAGVDLFNLIYKQYGMSNKAIIFTMDQKRARNAIIQRGINQSNWTVLVDTDRVVAQVMAEFNR